MNIAYKLMLKEIVDGCVKGNRISQRKLYEYFYGKMMGTCLRYAGNREEAVEILNTGFYKVFNNIQKYKFEEGALEAWIRRIMINTAIDHYRKEIKRTKTLDIVNAGSAKTEANVLTDLSAEDILKLVQNLPPAYRTVFNLFALEGFSHKEIADQLGISEGTSKSNLAKARAKLQNFINVQQANSENYAR